MNKICTTIEQSKKLIELGISTDTADMYWWTHSKRYYREAMDDGDFNKESDIPAWSLTALFEILPNDEVTSTTVTRGGWNIEPPKYLDIWFAEYETENHDNDFSLSANNPIDAAFEMVVWLKENNKI